MTNIIDSELNYSNIDAFFGSSQCHNYNIQINDKGNIIIKIKTTYNSPSHPSTVSENVVKIEDNKPIPSHILNICKIIFHGINKNTREVSMDIITWLQEIKKIQVEKNEYEKMKIEKNELQIKNKTLESKIKELEEKIIYAEKIQTNALQQNKNLQDKINRIQNDIIEKTIQNNNLHIKLEDINDLYTKLLRNVVVYNKKQL